MEHRSIKRLSKQTTNKIAAGEVVERPISIVKELVENSIDAGASSIVVEIKNGGKSYIRITDNGSGILPDEVEMAFERHATSKISDSDDLNRLMSLGFRGEALASIAAVSHAELITKTHSNQSGIQVKLDGGVLNHKKEIGCPNGTTIIISDLFYNTPARLKFLKQDSTEANLIIDFVSKISLAFSSISFRLINNGKILFSTSGSGQIYKSITSIYQKEIAQDLIHVSENNDLYELEAYISTSSNTRASKKYQIFFMNGRYIKSPLLDKALNNAYRELVFEGRYPIAFLFLKVK
ncbi:MAG: DNA mismatch repair endonuclease MutL, partial [Clostridia bacterium]|nr:DNA mismatch repair endonuclease MutL [Clostridia bacterium]